MDIVLIATIAANGVIGRDGTMPWHYPTDLAHFKETTMGHPVIMGRATFEDILDTLGEPLPGRTNVVLTRSERPFPAGVIRVESVDAALAAASEGEAGPVFVAGGASVYEQFLPLADRMILTHLHDSYPGDTYFPDWDPGAWDELSREAHDDFDIVAYRRRVRNEESP